MKKILLLISLLLFSSITFAQEDEANEISIAVTKECEEGYSIVSCEDIEGAKSESFCWKGEASLKQTNSVCRRTPKK